jgi:predicted dehydrogenase
LQREDIDAIYMPLPTGLHKEWITKALLAGKHVLAEKSLALDHDSARELVELAKAKRLLLMENFMFRYHSQHKAVWETLQNNRIGDIRLFRSQFGFPPLDSSNFRYDKAIGGGALLDAGAYTLRAAQWFLGRDLDVLSAVLYIDPSRDVDIYGNMTLCNKSGIVAQLSFGFDNFYQCNYEFWGSTGRLIANKAFTPKPTEKPRITVEKANETENLDMPADNHFVNILDEFYLSMVTNKHIEHLEDVLNQSKLLDQVRKTSLKVNL